MVCPICGSSVKHVPGESIHVTFERHSATSCDPNKHPSRTKRCGAPRCKEKLTTVNTYRCKDCGTEVCMTHRFPDKHACDDRKRESKRTSSSSFFGAGASTSNAARASQTKAQLRDKAARVSHSSVASGMRKRGEAAAREVCDVCGKSFPHIAALIAHAEQAHQVHGAATRARVTGGQSLGGGGGRDEFGSRGLSAVRKVVRGLDGAAEPRGTCARGTAAVLVVRVAVRRELTGLELVFKRTQM